MGISLRPLPFSLPGERLYWEMGTAPFFALSLEVHLLPVSQVQERYGRDASKIPTVDRIVQNLTKLLFFFYFYEIKEAL